MRASQLEIAAHRAATLHPPLNLARCLALGSGYNTVTFIPT